MFSVISVFNDEQVLTARLLGGLKRQQGAEYETITVDNRSGRFASAAAGLNHGARQARGEWLMFVHQDVQLIADDWLQRVEIVLNESKPRGWTGVAGMDDGGVFRGFLVDRAALIGTPAKGLTQVQTLDECVLIHRRRTNATPYFDEGLTGWHAYGVEACCRAIREAGHNYVLPFAVWHDSKSTNLARLEEAHQYVWHKHRELGRIYTTCGVLPDASSATTSSNEASFGGTAKSWWRMKINRAQGLRTRIVGFVGEALEELTCNEAAIDVLHARAMHHPVDARAFVQQPSHATRHIRHYFSGATVDSDSPAPCRVVMPDVGADLLTDAGALHTLKSDAKRLVLCFNLEDVRRHHAAWRALRRGSTACYVVHKSDKMINWDGLPPSVVISDIKI